MRSQRSQQPTTRRRRQVPFIACAIGILIAGATLTSYGITQRSHTAQLNVDQAASPAKNTVPSFTTADTGDCLNWGAGATSTSTAQSTGGTSTTNSGTTSTTAGSSTQSTTESGDLSNFSKTSCSSSHRFEVTARRDLGLYPNSAFAPGVALPSAQFQKSISTDLCKAATVDYLDHHYDPNGKWSIGLILPPEQNWKNGDRTALCGIYTTDSSGQAVATSGSAKGSDQSIIAQPGQCVALDGDKQRTVDCALDHAWEVTSVVDLTTLFPQNTSDTNPPSIQDQNTALGKTCTQAAMDYLGGDDALYNSTLQPFWTTRSAEEWAAGSRTVNCAIAKDAATDGQASTFAVLAGSAKGVFTINGQTPPPQPTRRPLRSTEASPSPEPSATQAP